MDSNDSSFQLNPVSYTDVMGDTSDISTSNGEYLFSLDDGRKGKTDMTVKQLYANGIQWFEPLADNYQKIVKISDSITTSKSLLHFTWKDVADFSEKDRWMISYRQKGDGDWKYKEAHGYYLITIDGYPYWPDAIGQIPFAVDYYTDVRLKFENNEDAIINTIQKGIQYGEGKIMGGTPDFSNTYDNYFIIRGAYWASKRYKEEGDELRM